MAHQKTQTGIVGVEVLDTFTVGAAVGEPFPLTQPPFAETCAFWHNGAAVNPVFSVNGNLLSVENLTSGDTLVIRYRPTGALQLDETVPRGVVHEFFNRSIIEFDHNMRKFPAVRIEDSAGTEWIASDIKFLGNNRIRIALSVSFSGRIILS